MSLAGELKRRLQMLFHRGRFQRDLDEEMRLHLELRRDQQMAAGADADSARRTALRRFGNTTRLREESQRAWGWEWLETLFQDAGYGIRSMLRTPGVTVIALLSLALGIGANTAIFSFLNAVMLRTLPVKDPQQLVKLGVENWSGITASFACTELYSYPFYREFRRKNAVFSDTAAYFSMVNGVHGFVDDRSEPELLNVQTVSGTYFRTLGVEAQIGRAIDEADDSSEGDHPVVVISDSFWKRDLGGDPGVLHHTLKLGDVVYQIVGVAPAEFFGTRVGELPDAWAPLSMAGLIPPHWGRYKDDFAETLYILGRLKPGVSMEQATANANVLFRSILLSFPDAHLTQDNLAHLNQTHLQLESMARGLSDLRNAYSEPLKVLMAIVALVLLIACANIANLLLARSTARARELAVRQALGAGRMRIIRQLLTESLVLALAGGALGIGFALAANRILLRMISHGAETLPLNVSLNLHLLAFTCAVTICTALLFGTLPALRATRLQLTESLKSGRGGSAATGRTPLARVLVVSQVAISLLLMVGACLFQRTLINLNHVKTGFNPDHVLTLSIDSDSKTFKDNDPRETAFFHEIEARVEAIPGVRAASFSAFRFHEGSWNSSITVPGMPVRNDINVRHNIIGDDYFRTMQIPLMAGRSFGPQDTPSSQQVAIISKHMARQLFPAGSPIGRTYIIGSTDNGETPTQYQVIGVAQDVKVGDLAEPTKYIDYMPYTQRAWGFGDFEVRYSGDLAAVSKGVQQAIHAVDRSLPISDVSTLSEQVARSYTNETLIAELSAFFALVAVFLSCIGIYGVMSYLVGRRTGEIGIRMALGARRSAVAWQVMREIMILVLCGIAIGLPAALAGGRLVGKLLYGLTGNDPVSMAAAVAVLILAGLLAGYLPARRAARIDPLTALRYE
ncbi:MAG TPA: ABC transporter permease [Acidobacteriaceae bacterium]|jgi:predicted permease|nr:ABC transporter permease [Acidobacteriaceae bacterium]